MMKSLNLIIVFAVLSFLVCVSVAEQPAPLKIYLPRTKVISSANVNLENVAYVSGTDKALSDKARAVKLGRAPFPGEQIEISRQVILARLAGSGIYPEQVKITGADQIQIRRDSSTIASDDFVNAAQDFVKAKLAEKNIAWELARKPVDLNIAGQEKCELICSESPTHANGQMRVSVNVVRNSDGKSMATRELLFNLKYFTQQVKATCDIYPGEIISPENSKVESILVDRQPREVSLPLGLKATKHIQKDAVISGAMVFKPEPEILVERNRTVRIKIVGPTWRITTLGTALQDGRCGDAIRVRNVDSQKVIVARVDKAGDVVPVMASR